VTGKRVDLFIPNKTGTSTTATTLTITGIPTHIRSSETCCCSVDIYDNAMLRAGSCFIYPSGTINFNLRITSTGDAASEITYTSTGFQPSSNRGTHAQVISYYI
jgi:hypothetical protein